MATFSTSYQVEVDTTGTGWTVIPAAQVVNVRGLAELSGNRVAPLLAGDVAAQDVTLTIRQTALATVPRDMPVRITYTVDGNQARAFVGSRRTARRSRQGATWELACVGVQARIAKLRAESRMFEHRAVATKTTAASVEDPTDAAYQGGPINYALWSAGGRPWEQSAAYPAAPWYYSCDQAVLAPARSWFHGENAWDECLRLVRAAGGQLYQDQAGIVRYRQPLGFGDGVATHTFADTGPFSTTRTVYKDLEEEDTGEAVSTRVVCPYVPRVTLPSQVVAEYTTPRVIPGLESLTIPIDLQHPVDNLETLTASTLKPEAVLMVGTGGFVAPTSMWSHTVTWYAQRVELTFTNLQSAPLTLEKVTLRGAPNVPAEASSVAVGSSDTANTLTIEESLYIQQESDALLLANLFLAMQTGQRTVRTIRDCPYDPLRTVGETVNLEDAALGIPLTRHAIIAIEHDETGRRASSYTLVDVSALPKASDYYQVGTTNYSGQTKMLSW